MMQPTVCEHAASTRRLVVFLMHIQVQQFALVRARKLISLPQHTHTRKPHSTQTFIHPFMHLTTLRFQVPVNLKFSIADALLGVIKRAQRQGGRHG